MTHVKAFVVSYTNSFISYTHPKQFNFKLNLSIQNTHSPFFLEMTIFYSLIYSFIVICIHIHLLHYRCTWKGMRYGSGICTAHLKRNRRLTLDWKTSTDLNVSCEGNLVKTFQRKNICVVCSQWGGKNEHQTPTILKCSFLFFLMVM